MAVRKWVWVAAASGCLVVVLLVGLAGFGLYFVARQVHTQPSTMAAARQEFDRVRAQFAGRPPLIDFSPDEAHPVVHREAAAGPPVALEALEVLAWSADPPRLVRASIPFWLVRISPGPFNASGVEVPLDARRLHVTPGDIERYGRGIILDVERPDGARVLVVAR